jgi:N-acetylglucosamine-6-sulfatase
VLDKFTRTNKPWYLQINSLAPHHGGPGRARRPVPRHAGPAQLGQGQVQLRDHPRSGCARQRPARAGRVRQGADHPACARSSATASGARSAPRRASAPRRSTCSTSSSPGSSRSSRPAASSSKTIVAFTSDNGYMEGEHRWQSGKVDRLRAVLPRPAADRRPGRPALATAQVLPGQHRRPLRDRPRLGRRAPHRSATAARSSGDIGANGAAGPSAVGYESFLPNIRNDHDPARLRQRSTGPWPRRGRPSAASRCRCGRRRWRARRRRSTPSSRRRGPGRRPWRRRPGARSSQAVQPTT